MMLTVAETATYLRAECGSCGAHNNLPRPRTLNFGRFDRTTTAEPGRWLRCTVCGDLSRLEEPVERSRQAA
jgi:hypothetical protein